MPQPVDGQGPGRCCVDAENSKSMAAAVGAVSPRPRRYPT